MSSPAPAAKSAAATAAGPAGTPATAAQFTAAQVTGTLVTGSSRVAFRSLSMRPDGDSWVIGRVDTGDFIAAPAAAQQVITLLDSGHTVAAAARRLEQETGAPLAVADLVEALDELGFVAEIDGRARPGPAPVRASLRWLRPGHVRWLLHPATAGLVLAIIAGAAVTAAVDHALVPQYRILVWSRHSGLVLVTDAALAWGLAWLHELAHLGTARAAGVPARFALSTRLQFLAVQTDVSGVWAAPRRVRVTVYLAGMAVNLLVSSGCVLVLGLADPAGLARRLLSVLALMALLPLPLQLLIFMRTDVYFLVQDLAGCANLYADGSARVRYLLRRAWHAARRAAAAPSGDPSAALPRRERRAVRAYAWLLLAGTAGALAVAVSLTIPAEIALAAHAVGEVSAGSVPDQVDGLAALIVLAGFQALWLRAWLRRHGRRVAAWLRARRPPAPEGR